MTTTSPALSVGTKTRSTYASNASRLTAPSSVIEQRTPRRRSSAATKVVVRQ